MCSGTELVNFGEVTYPVFVDLTTTLTQETSTGGRGTVAVPTSQEVTLLAPMFQLNYRSSDLAPTTTPPPTMLVSPSRSSVSIASTDSNSASSIPLTPASEQDGLSTGAIVGIAVGAALGGILLGVLAILLFIRNRKKRAAAAAWPGTQTAELPLPDYKYVAEVSAMNQPNYAGIGARPNYVGFESEPVELPTGNGRWSQHHAPNPGYS
jgi:hypothetical protein